MKNRNKIVAALRSTLTSLAKTLTTNYAATVKAGAPELVPGVALVVAQEGHPSKGQVGLFYLDNRLAIGGNRMLFPSGLLDATKPASAAQIEKAVKALDEARVTSLFRKISRAVDESAGQAEPKEQAKVAA